MAYNFPAGKKNQMVDAFAENFNYQDVIPDPNDPTLTIPNPETREQHAKRRIDEYVEQIVKFIHRKHRREEAEVIAEAEIGGFTAN